MPWRYWTTPDCIRHWHLFRHVGPAEVVRSIVGPCTRAGALAMPLLAGPAAAPLPPAPRTPLPWIGQPDLYGGGAYGLGGPGFGFGGGFGGEYGYAGGGSYTPAAASMVPGGQPAVGIANTGPQEVQASPTGPQALATLAGGAGVVPMPAEGAAAPAMGGSPMLTSDTSQPVPCPSGLAVLLTGMIGLAWCRARQNGDRNRADTLAGRATSTHGVTHA